MARGDRTGPMGMGPMTGRGAGFCAGFAVPGFENQVGIGSGFGRGRGRGLGRIFYRNGVPVGARMGYAACNRANEAGFDEKQYLSSQAELLENQLQQVKQRLANLKKDVE